MELMERYLKKKKRMNLLLISKGCLPKFWLQRVVDQVLYEFFFNRVRLSMILPRNLLAFFLLLNSLSEALNLMPKNWLMLHVNMNSRIS
jgi:hypothetical protein